MERTYHRERCQTLIRRSKKFKNLTREVSVTLVGTHAFEWKIVVLSSDNEVITFEYNGRIQATQHYNALLKKYKNLF